MRPYATQELKTIQYAKGSTAESGTFQASANGSSPPVTNLTAASFELTITAVVTEKHAAGPQMQDSELRRAVCVCWGDANAFSAANMPQI